jgi:hypothetical protein
VLPKKITNCCGSIAIAFSMACPMASAAMAGHHHNHNHIERNTDAQKHPFSDRICLLGPFRMCDDGSDSPKRIRLRSGSNVQDGAHGELGFVPSMSRKRASRRHVQSSAILAKRAIATRRLSREEGRRLADYLLPADKINETFNTLGKTHESISCNDAVLYAVRFCMVARKSTASESSANLPTAVPAPRKSPGMQ